MDRIEEIIDNFKDCIEKVERSREETIKELFKIRKRAIRHVDNANRTLRKRCNELRVINETICEIQGHSYTDWEEHDGFLDRTWYYTRKCELCGLKERVENEPLEYREQQEKKMNIKKKVK